MTTIQTTSKPVVHLAGSWFNDTESMQLMEVPHLRIDDAGRMWAQVGDEPAQHVHQIERLASCRSW